MSPLQHGMLQQGAASHMSSYTQLMQLHFQASVAHVPEKTHSVHKNILLNMFNLNSGQKPVGFSICNVILSYIWKAILQLNWTFYLEPAVWLQWLKIKVDLNINTRQRSMSADSWEQLESFNLFLHENENFLIPKYPTTTFLLVAQLPSTLQWQEMTHGFF